MSPPSPQPLKGKVHDRLVIVKYIVFSLCVSKHKHKITIKLLKILAKLVIEVARKERKNTLVGRICVLYDRNKRLLARSLLLF